MRATSVLGRIVVLSCTAYFPALLMGQGNAMFQSGAGDGHALGNSAFPASSTGIFASGVADGYAQGEFSGNSSTAGVFTSGAADGHAQGVFNGMSSTAGVFTSGAADGYAQGTFNGSASTVGIFDSGVADGHSLGAFTPVYGTAGIFASGIGDGYATNFGTNVEVSIQGLAFLEGPYNAGTQLMNDNLRVAGLVPLTEPYTALGFPNTPGSGGESTTPGSIAIGGPGAMVDWVRVELRDAAVPTTLVTVRHALVNRSGAILDPSTGDDVISLNAQPGNYYVVVRHRNHLGAMTAAPVALTGTPTNIDFSLLSAATFGTAAQKTIGAKTLLWAGDVTGNRQLKYTGSGNDRDPILVAVGSTTPNSILPGLYDRRDVNMDGTVKYTGSANDRDPILVNVGSTTPNNTRTEQVP